MTTELSGTCSLRAMQHYYYYYKLTGCDLSLEDTILHCTALYYFALYYTALYYTALHYIRYTAWLFMPGWHSG